MFAFNAFLCSVCFLYMKKGFGLLGKCAARSLEVQLQWSVASGSAAGGRGGRHLERSHPRHSRNFLEQRYYELRPCKASIIL